MHPHLQGIADHLPTALCALYLKASEETANRDYWDYLVEEETGGPRHLFGEEIFWYANPVPIGECEIRGILPVRTMPEIISYADVLAQGLITIINCIALLDHMRLIWASSSRKPGLQQTMGCMHSAH